MSITICEYCDEYVDMDTNLEHWIDDEGQICEKEINKLDYIDRGDKRFYHNEGEFVYREYPEGTFETGHDNEFAEIIEDEANEAKLNHKYPNR